MSGDLSGEIIKGYHLQELIGVGGFGAIYRAFQPSLTRSVAIKAVLPEFVNHPEFIRNFESEAQLIARLEHLHIVPLYDYWREPDNAYLVMRWMRGGSLRESLLRHGPWEPVAAARLLEQVAAALTLAHQQGVIHRDIKPGNILLDEQGNAYLTDFGIAKELVEQQTVVRETQLVGSPDYLAPEVLRDRMTSTSADIYSLGIVLYEMLTGNRPFEESDTSTIISKQITRRLPALQGLEPGLARSLNAVIWRATAKTPAARYGDALQMAEDFRRVTTGTKSAPDTGLSPETLTGGKTPAPEAQVGDKTPIIESGFFVQNPYKGLRAFEQADAADFFGRSALVQRLLARLSEGTGRFLAVVGPSGSGKSSVVKAGLIPALRAGRLPGSNAWFFAELVPGSDPWQELATALLKAVNAMLPDKEGAELFLLIDQFEEVFTLVEDEADRLALMRSLALAVTGAQSKLRVVITLRGDFYDRPLNYGGVDDQVGFGDLMRDATEVVLPLSPPELVQAITGPAQRLGMIVEEDLIASIIADVNEQSASLPLLQYALTELFDRRDGRQLTHAAYQEFGGVLGALARRAEEVYEGQNAVSKAVAKQLFLRLVAVDETNEGRRRVRWSALKPIANAETIQPLLDLFGKHRLLTFDRDPNTREPTVEVAHEALLRSWQRLRGWLDDSRENLLTYRRLAEAVAQWQQAGRDPSFLVSGARLAQFEVLAGASEISLSREERRFIRDCVAQRQRSARRLRLFIATLIVLLAAALVLAGLSIDRENRALAARDDANAQASLARSRELAALALSNDTPFDLALLLSLEALRSDTSFEARNSLWTLLRAQPQLSRILHHGAAVRTIAYHPAGALLAAGGADHTITLWDMATGQSVGEPLVGHEDVVNSLAFSPDGDWLASGSSDQAVRLWALDETGVVSVVHTLTGHTDAVWSVAFSPDGALLASAGADDTVRLWEVASGEPVGDPLVGHTDDVFTVAFSPDGTLLASAGADVVAADPSDEASDRYAVVRLWEVATGEPTAALTGVHTNWITALAFSPDGQLLLTASYDTTVQLWLVQTGEPLDRPLSGHTDWVRSVDFSPDGTRFASAGRDGRVIIWGMADWPPEPVAVLSGQQDRVWSARFNPAGGGVASASLDGTVWVWEPDANLLARQVIPAHDGLVARLAFSPDGRFLASGSMGEEAEPLRLWDAETGVALDQEAALPASLTRLAFSPDGRALVAADAGGSLFLWLVSDAGELLPDEILANAEVGASGVIRDVAFDASGQVLAVAQNRSRVVLWGLGERAPVGELSGPEAWGNIFSVAFAPAGELLAAGTEAGAVALWDVSTGELHSQPLQGHSDPVIGVAFSPDGRYLASASRDLTVGLWDVASGTLIGRLAGHEDWVQAVVFSPDGRLLASASADGVVMLWDVATQRLVGLPLPAQRGGVSSLAFSPDSEVLAVGGPDAMIILWEMTLSVGQQRACEVANRDLSPAEWRQFFPTIDYRSTCRTVPQAGQAR